MLGGSARPHGRCQRSDQARDRRPGAERQHLLLQRQRGLGVHADGRGDRRGPARPAPVTAQLPRTDEGGPAGRLARTPFRHAGRQPKRQCRGTGNGIRQVGEPGGRAGHVDRHRKLWRDDLHGHRGRRLPAGGAVPDDPFRGAVRVPQGALRHRLDGAHRRTPTRAPVRRSRSATPISTSRSGRARPRSAVRRGAPPTSSGSTSPARPLAPASTRRSSARSAGAARSRRSPWAGHGSASRRRRFDRGGFDAPRRRSAGRGPPPSRPRRSPSWPRWQVAARRSSPPDRRRRAGPSAVPSASHLAPGLTRRPSTLASADSCGWPTGPAGSASGRRISPARTCAPTGRTSTRPGPRSVTLGSSVRMSWSSAMGRRPSCGSCRPPLRRGSCWTTSTRSSRAAPGSWSRSETWARCARSGACPLTGRRPPSSPSCPCPITGRRWGRSGSRSRRTVGPSPLAGWVVRSK